MNNNNKVIIILFFLTICNEKAGEHSSNSSTVKILAITPGCHV
uniref:Uncharacterized protein n=1 Tax=Anguilla anguilla TaxID=7936 RepID=A0A0E9T8L4_ANGAN